MLALRITCTVILWRVNEVVDSRKVLLICGDRLDLLLLLIEPWRHWLLFAHGCGTGLIEGGGGLGGAQGLRSCGLCGNRGYRIIEAPRRCRSNRTGELAGG